MKKEISILVIIALAMVTIGYAQPAPPMIVPVKVTGIVDGTSCDVTIQNMRTNEIVTGKTNQYGEFLYDWSNTASKFLYGDVFRVKIGDSIQEQILEKDVLNIMYFDMPCPKIPVTEEPIPTCDDSQYYSIIIGIIAFLLGIGGGAYYKRTGIRLTKDSAGKTVVAHKHPGIVGYHNINTVHNVIKIRHKKGEVAPKYDADGKYVP